MFDALRPLLIVQRALTKHNMNPLQFSAEEHQHLIQVARSASTGHVSREESRKSQLRTVLRKADELTTQLSTWEWSVLTSDGPALITGDVPAVTIRPGGGWRGILEPGSPVFLPLSPVQLLIGEPSRLARTERLTHELATAVNRSICTEAYDAIMTKSGADWPPGAKLSSVRPRLGSPHITWSCSQGERPTFPVTYPAVSSSGIRSLLRDLEAHEAVQ